MYKIYKNWRGEKALGNEHINNTANPHICTAEIYYPLKSPAQYLYL
jgi:hypothetical protein